MIIGIGVDTMKQYLISDINISKNIVNLRKAAGLTQNYVAIKLQTMGLNISRSRLSMIELNRLNVPVSMIVALKIIFKCEYADFFIGLEEKLSELGMSEN